MDIRLFSGWVFRNMGDINWYKIRFKEYIFLLVVGIFSINRFIFIN